MPTVRVNTGAAARNARPSHRLATHRTLPTFVGGVLLWAGLLLTGLVLTNTGQGGDDPLEPTTSSPPAEPATTEPVDAEPDTTEPLPAQPARIEPARIEPVRPLPPAWRDDAALHALACLGANTAFVAGDHGVLLKTNDAGESWRPIETGTTASLQAIVAPTDKFLIVVGGERAAWTGESRGVVLISRDGGATWTDKARTSEGQRLPRLTGGRFFSPQQGLVWGDPAGEGSLWAGAALFRTEDGGDTWLPVPAMSSVGWQAGAFIDLDQGVVANRLGDTRLVLGFESQPTRLDRLADRRLHAIQLLRGGGGWLAGDSGTLLKTENSGVSWTAATPLSPAVRRTVDFHAVWSDERVVLAAGMPGSIVCRSLDSGATWETVRTPVSAPLSALQVTPSGTGYAVGAWGQILRTTNAGETWNVVRGGERRAAALVIAARESEIPWTALADYSGEQGFRTQVTVVAPNREAPRHSAAEALVPAVGAGGLDAATRLAIDRPDLDRNAAQLIAAWDETTEGTWRRQLVATLVRELRAWRPSVVIAGPALPGDAVSALVHEAIAKACDEAADSTRHLELADQLQLPTWPVARLFLMTGDHMAPGSGGVTLDPARYLPHLRSTGDTFVARVGGRSLGDGSLARSGGFSLAFSRAERTDGQRDAPTDLFSGLRITPDSPARRPWDPIDSELAAGAERSARNRKTVDAFLVRTLGETGRRDDRAADQLIANLPEIVRDLPPDEAAAQLSSISTRYKVGGRWDAAEQVCLELLRKYPNEPATQVELATQVQLWASAEWGWRSVRKAAIQAERWTGGDALNSGKTPGTIVPVNGDDAQAEAGERARSTVQNAGAVVLRRNVTERLEQRGRIAEQAAAALAKSAPSLAAAPEVRFALAAAGRNMGRTAFANDIYRPFAGQPGPGLWPRAALTEQWLIQPVNEPALPIRSLYAARQRPILDGLLSDPCWETAEELATGSPNPAASSSDQREGTSGPALLMLAYDRSYLYVAGTVPRAQSGGDFPEVAKQRSHDTPLDGHDRITLVLDVDRDYNTAWEWTIDERGLTRDACCGDDSWNPRYFLASQADPDAWRFELAIPWDELVAEAPTSSTRMAWRVRRVIPGVGWQDWPHLSQAPSATSTTTTPTTTPYFGILAFEE
jgi:photosystem II stability/assembly factor-like uncharacterized protein